MLLLLVPAAVSLIGCGSSGSTTGGGTTTAGAAPFSAATLRGALLTKVNGKKPAARADTGTTPRWRRQARAGRCPVACA